MERLKQLRKKSHLSQKQLADYLGITQSMVARLEDGSRKLNSTLISKLCDLWNISEEYLLCEVDKCDTYEPINFKGDIKSLRGIAQLNRIFRNIKEMNEMLNEGEEQ